MCTLIHFLSGNNKVCIYLWKINKRIKLGELENNYLQFKKMLVSGDMPETHTCTIYSMVENCGMSSAGWFTSEIPA